MQSYINVSLFPRVRLNNLGRRLSNEKKIPARRVLPGVVGPGPTVVLIVVTAPGVLGPGVGS